MLRIIAGRFKNRRLHVPQNNRATRPTLDRVKEALFNIIVHNRQYPSLAGIVVLDLFAGSGSLGFEALSRGARTVTFVDHDPRSLQCCENNAAALDVQDVCRIQRGDTRSVHFVDGPFEWILIDPPYYKGMSEPTLMNVLQQGALKKGGAIALEMAADESLQLPEGLRVDKETVCGPERLYILLADS